MRRTTFAPIRCPASRGCSRRTAQRPFPSMIIATCSPGKVLAKVLCFIKRQSKKERGSPFADGLDERFHVVQVLLERPPASRGQPVLGARDPVVEGLLAGDVLRLLELPRVHAQIPVG